jgi:transposase
MAMVLYSGIDLHKNSCMITTVDPNGTILKQQNLPTNADRIVAYFASMPAEHSAVIETTTGWYWLNDLLESQGVNVTLAHATYLKAISYAKVKTDKIDSETLAHLLRMQMIPAAYRLEQPIRSLRDLLRARLLLVHSRINCRVAQQMMMLKFNCNSPDDLTEHYRYHYDLQQQQRELLTRQIRDLEKRLAGQMLVNEDVQRLLEIPGVGPITAMAICLEVGDIGRFSSAKNFVSYCRLVPGAANSGGKQHHKSGSKNGNRYLKIAMTQAAVHAVRRYDEYKTFYQRKARKKPAAIARTLVAKELARIVWHILTHKVAYQGLKGQAISRPKPQYW